MKIRAQTCDAGQRLAPLQVRHSSPVTAEACWLDELDCTPQGANLKYDNIAQLRPHAKEEASFYYA